MYSRLLEKDLNKNKNSECMIGIGAYCPGPCQTYMTHGGGNRTSKDGAKGIELLCFHQKLENDANGQFWQLNVGKNNEYKLIHTPWKQYMHF